MANPRSSVTQDSEVDEKGLGIKDDELTHPASKQSGGLSHADVAVRAYQYWWERGCPEGSPEVDWNRAEEDLRTENAQSTSGLRSAAASA